MVSAQSGSQSVFNDTYVDARTMFIGEANKTGAITESFEHPARQGPHGETLTAGALTMDTAWIGPRDATAVMVMICGTHGPESFTGAALQLDWLQQHKQLPSASMAMLLIHAANPFGWAYCSRTTENNVDLNRNFIDHSHPPEQGALTQPIQKLLSRSSAKGPHFKRILFGLVKRLLRIGPTKILDEISQGQYSHPNGIGFGGNSAEWSNLTLRSIFTRQLRHAERVTIIDWHTGIGKYGKPCFLCFDHPNTDEYKRARRMWGAGIDNSNASYSSGKRPSYQGLLINALRDTAQATGAKTTSCVIEFGTYSNIKMLKALLIDRWLRCAANAAKPETKIKLQTQMLRLFYPSDPYWRASVLKSGNAIILKSLASLHDQMMEP
tara:strand:+ start:264 stop:1406 length:1143 start_codon:yes stop_codon:yes gene_type:complete